MKCVGAVLVSVAGGAVLDSAGGDAACLVADICCVFHIGSRSVALGSSSACGCPGAG